MSTQRGWEESAGHSALCGRPGLRACVFSQVSPATTHPAGEEALVQDTAADLAVLVPDVPVTILWHGARSFDPPIDWWRAAMLGISD